MELAEDQSLLSDADKCMEARTILIHPRNRISAEIAWLPGVNPELTGEILNVMKTPNQTLQSITELTSIARANYFVSKFSRLRNLSTSNVVKWILAIARASEGIDSESVCLTINEDRSISGFPIIQDLSTLDTEIQKQKRYFGQTLSSTVNNFSVNERAVVLTSTLETVSRDSNRHIPVLIEELIQTYEIEVAADLEKKQKIIEAQDEKLRAMVEAKNADSTLQPIVNQLLDAVRDWDNIAQPIQLNKRSRGERHSSSFEIAWRVQRLAVDFYNKFFNYDFSLQLLNLLLYDFSLQFLNMLLEVFAEVPEIVEQIRIDKEELIKAHTHVEGLRKFKEINDQVEKLKKSVDANSPHTVLASLIAQLIQTVKTWNVSTQPIEANQTVAYLVRSIALHLWNKHQKLDYSLQITKMLKTEFGTVPSISKHIDEDIKALEGMKKFEEINTQVEKLRQAADAYKPDSTLIDIGNRLIEIVNTWVSNQHPTDANRAVINTVRNIAIYLYSEHKKFDLAERIITSLFMQINDVDGMNEINELLTEDLVTLTYYKNSSNKSRGSSCLLQIVFFFIMGLIGILLQGC